MFTGPNAEIAAQITVIGMLVFGFGGIAFNVLFLERLVRWWDRP